MEKDIISRYGTIHLLILTEYFHQFQPTLQIVRSHCNRVLNNVGLLFFLAEMDRSYKKLRNLKRDVMAIAKSSHDPEVLDLKNEINDKINEIREVETRLPGNNGFYLRLIVGDLNLTLPTSELKRKYKENYEKWKLGKFCQYKNLFQHLNVRVFNIYFENAYDLLT